jgi:anti-sigma factor RsiW
MRPVPRGSERDAGFGVAGEGHLTANALHDWVDDRLDDAERAWSQRHLDGCAACGDELRVLETMVSLGPLAYSRAATIPDMWPVVRAATVDAHIVRRQVLRRLRLPLIVWTLAAVFAGAAATEIIREWSRRVASASVAANAIATRAAAEREAKLGRDLRRLQSIPTARPNDTRAR